MLTQKRHIKFILPLYIIPLRSPTMKLSLKNTLFATLAAALLSCIALPGLASAEICNKIDFTFDSKVMDQVRLYAGNSSVTARDAACVLKKLDFASTQEEVGVYLIPRLVDPQNIDLLINAVDFQSTKDALTKAGIENQANRPAHHPAPMAHHPAPAAPVYHHTHTVTNNSPDGTHHSTYHVETTVTHHAHNYRPSAPSNPHVAHHAHAAHHAPRLNVAQNVNQKIDYTFASKILDQVKLYVGNSTYIYAADAAEIIKKANFASYQEEIGTYLCPKLADRDNIHLLINAVDFQSTKDALIKACSN